MKRLLIVVITMTCLATIPARGDQSLLQKHCSKCHSGPEPKGDFTLKTLGRAASSENIDYWTTSLDYVRAGEMPPAKQSTLSDDERKRLVAYLQDRIRQHDRETKPARRRSPRRLNNREFAKSLADVLLIEDLGTHEPVADLLGDTLYDGFDTNGDALGLSEFHLERYINAFRKVIDATVLSGEQPESQHIVVTSDDLRVSDRSNRRRQEKANRTAESIEILDIRNHAYFANFETVPISGRYRIRIRAAGIDRNVYDAAQTGHYSGDPIRLRVRLGDRVRDFDLPDEEVAELVVDEWLAAGTRIELHYPTDALRLRGNGNFKFQYRIAHDYIKDNDPKLYRHVVEHEVPRARTRSTAPEHWVHWTGYWQGPRPRLFGAEIEGPFYETWPPRRQTALLGASPSADQAAELLRPIAERAWRRDVDVKELSGIASLVKSRADNIGDLNALKEGLVAVLASPSFLLINPESGTPADRFATKLSYFLSSTTPTGTLRTRVQQGQLHSLEAVRAEVQRQLASGAADEFVQQFPRAWLQLDRINFMAPDPDRYPLYERKRISEDMIAEVVRFFRHAVDNNVPVPELLTADYSFINADLAKVYAVEGVPQDSRLRKYTFADGRRGGLLGMGAFLTLTADSLSTSPIHRAIFVMENFLGLHPSPPPADVLIEEPDVRSAKTIKEVLEAHRADKTCASCHQSIDPFGYAFENFDPTGAWRDQYTEQIASRPGRARLDEIRKEDAERAARGLPPVPKPWENKPIPVDASASFLGGAEYHDIREFRQLMQTTANRDRFVRCFIVKLLTYANGAEPDDYSEVERIVERAAAADYRIIDTIAAVIHSPLFREG